MGAVLTAERAPRTSGTRYASAGVAFVGLAAVAVGCFLPTADPGSVSWERLHENSLRASGIAWLTLALCVVVGAALAASLYRRTRTLGPLFGGLLVLAEAVYIAASELTTCAEGTAVVDAAVCETASPGIGLFVLAAGGAALVVAGPHLATIRASPPERVAATADADGRLPAQLAAYGLDSAPAPQLGALEQLQQELRARDGHVRHGGEFKGYYLFLTETVFVASGRSHDHGFELRAGEWVPFTPDTRSVDLDGMLTLADAVEWKESPETEAPPA